MLLLALLLSIFTFSGSVRMAQQNSLHIQSELVLPADRIAKSTVGYSRITRGINSRQHLYIPRRTLFAIAIATFNRAVTTQHICLATPIAPRLPGFRQIHRHMPTAPEPPHQA
ncbi:MAG: hypothetical protein V4456_07755 [Bacteroidota bacterium]